METSVLVAERILNEHTLYVPGLVRESLCGVQRTPEGPTETHSPAEIKAFRAENEPDYDLVAYEREPRWEEILEESMRLSSKFAPKKVVFQRDGLAQIVLSNELRREKTHRANTRRHKRRRSAAMLQLRADRRDNGLCNCGALPSKGFLTCSICREINRLNQRDRRSNG